MTTVPGLGEEGGRGGRSGEPGLTVSRVDPQCREETVRSDRAGGTFVRVVVLFVFDGESTLDDGSYTGNRRNVGETPPERESVPGVLPRRGRLSRGRVGPLNTWDYSGVRPRPRRKIQTPRDTPDPPPSAMGPSRVSVCVNV